MRAESRACVQLRAHGAVLLAQGFRVAHLTTCMSAPLFAPLHPASGTSTPRPSFTGTSSPPTCWQVWQSRAMLECAGGGNARSNLGGMFTAVQLAGECVRTEHAPPPTPAWVRRSPSRGLSRCGRGCQAGSRWHGAGVSGWQQDPGQGCQRLSVRAGSGHSGHSACRRHSACSMGPLPCSASYTL